MAQSQSFVIIGNVIQSVAEWNKFSRAAYVRYRQIVDLSIVDFRFNPTFFKAHKYFQITQILLGIRFFFFSAFKRPLPE